jgi:hypothetical protein
MTGVGDCRTTEDGCLEDDRTWGRPACIEDARIEDERYEGRQRERTLKLKDAKDRGRQRESTIETEDD